jgi:uncharacterized protein (TIGR02301 family)
MHACGIDARQPAKEFAPDVETRMPRISRALRFRIFALSATAVAACAPVHAAGSPDSKPYDDKLMRLSEILGAVHYLRELCGAGEGQLWRERMQELVQSEGSSALRKARLTRSFNQGYRSYSRTYNACTPSAQTAINRFLTEGAQIAETLVKTIP